MRLILPGLALLLLTACGLKDDLYLAEDTSAGQATDDPREPEADERGREQDEVEDDDDATYP